MSGILSLEWATEPPVLSCPQEGCESASMLGLPDPPPCLGQVAWATLTDGIMGRGGGGKRESKTKRGIWQKPPQRVQPLGPPGPARFIN